MGCVTSGTTRNCATKKIGGSNFLYVADRQDVDSITIDPTGEISAITMVAAAVFYKFEFAPNQSNYTETGANSGEWVQAYTFVNEGRDQAKRNAIQELADCNCGLVVIHGENTGKTWLWGFNEGEEAEFETGVNNSGTAKSDINNMTTTLQASATEQAREFIATIPV